MLEEKHHPRDRSTRPMKDHKRHVADRRPKERGHRESNAKGRGRDGERYASPTRKHYHAKSRGREGRSPSSELRSTKKRGGDTARTSKSRAKSRGRDVERYSSPKPRQSRREHDITRRRSPSPELRPTKSHAKSRGRDIERYASPKPRQSRREYDITRRRSPSPELRPTKSHAKSRGGETARTSKSHAKSRGRDVGRYASPKPRQPRREYDITRRRSPSPALPLTKSRGDKARRSKSSAKKKHHDKEPTSEMNLVFGELQKLADVSAAHEHIVKFTSEHELVPTSLGNKWLDLVDTYVMPSVKEAGFFGDDTTCFTGTTGWVTEADDTHLEEDACMLEKHEKNQKETTKLLSKSFKAPKFKVFSKKKGDMPCEVLSHLDSKSSTKCNTIIFESRDDDDSAVGVESIYTLEL